MVDPIGAAQVGLGVLGLFGANKAQKEQNKLTRAQTAIARFYGQQMKDYAPQQADAIRYYRQRAGLDLGTGGGGALGIYNSPEYQALRSQANEEATHFGQQQARNFTGQVANRGLLGSSLHSGGLARISSDASAQYAGFLRNLAQQAADKQDALVNAYFGALQGPLSGGSQAAQIFGQAASQYGNQAAAGYAGLGSALQNYTQNEALRRYQSQQNGNGEPDYSRYNYDGSRRAPVNPALQGRAMGGPVHPGQPYMVGEQGPEIILPATDGYVIPHHALQTVWF